MQPDRARLEAFALTPLQEGMLFHTLLAPGGGAYFSQYAFTLRGRVDVAVLRRAWQAAVDRHPALRTAFVWEGVAHPEQVVHPAATLPWTELDWRSVDPSDRADRLAELRAADRARGFSLHAPPLMRVAVVRTEDDEWEVTWSHHHLLLDGWSSPIVLRDVFTAYAALAAGAEPALPPARPYADYLRWLGARGEDGSESFWRGTLAGFAEPTPLAAGRFVAEGEGQGVETVRCTPVATAALRSLARRHRLTLNTVVQGAWALCLARRSGERDVVFGATASGRPAGLEGVEEMVGLFINTLPVRARVEADAGLVPWLAALQERQAEAREHEHTPLVRVQEWSEVPRGRALFDSILVFENFPVDEVLAGLELPFAVEGWTGHEQTSFPLTIVALPGARLALKALYDRAKLDADTVRRALAQLRTLLEGMAAGDDARLGDLALMDDAERRQVLEAWNATDSGYPRAATVVSAFAEQAAATPGAVALSFAGQAMTYAEVDARANRIARVLRDRGVRHETRVGVSMERALDLPVVLLAILKAGGAYVPLDPSYPADRLTFMRRDAGVELVVTQRAQAGPDAFPGAAVLVLEDAEDEIASAAADAIDGGATADSLAYVIYTSGSTGTPKGVAVPHRGVLRLVLGNGYARIAGETFLLLAPVAFDASTLELWGPLLNGGRLAIHPGEATLERIAGSIRAEGVTTLWMTAGLFHLAVDERIGMFAGLGQLLTGGDVVSPAHVARVRQAHPELRVILGYGPTETTTFAAARTVQGGDEAGALPLGGPIADTRLYVVGAEMSPVPVGVPGELLIGGDGVARGYLNRPALTAGAFIPDPFSGISGARLYRTGDRARWLPDGTIDFLGRIDQQVKVRGFRIEPGEIEAALRAEPAVREAAVIVRQDAAGDRRLVAYVVAEDADAEALRASLRARLPEHMVPAAVVVLSALPLTPNGKLDRRALPAPERAGDGYVAPRTETERRLASIWSDVLGVERVGVDDAFVTLGGHSLLATRLISRVRDAFGAELPLRALFEAPTVAALAARLETDANSAAAGAIPALPRDGRPLPVSFAQRRLWFMDQLEPGSAAYNIPGAYRVSGALDVEVLERVFASIVRRHEALRTTFAVADGEPVQVIGAADGFTLARIDLSDLSQDKKDKGVRQAIRDEAARPFDLASGPLFRAGVIRLSDHEHVLLVTLHHIVGDGWSVGVLAREAEALYAAFGEGRESPLAELPVQYADYAAWQRARVTGPVLDAQVAFWRERLAGAPPRLELPTDRPRAATPSPEGRIRRLTLSPQATAAVRELARREGATLFMTLAAAFQALLARWSGDEDVSIGTPVAGRGPAAAEAMIGFFVNTLVLRTDFSGDPTFAALLGRVRETVLAAHAHQDVPFEKLVEELKPARELGQTPFFQAMFTLLERAPAPALGTLAVEAVEDDAAPAKFDLDVMVTDGGERLTLSFQYRAELWDAETIDRMAGHYAALLEHAAAHPDAPVADAPLLGEAERACLAAWNHTASEYPAATIHGLFLEQAARTPHAVALIADGEAFTYAELDAHSARVARRLRALGVGLETRVGVLLGRGAELLPSLLGILRAGAAYVPLDPAYPAERLALTLEDSAAPVLLTERRLAALAPPFAGRVLCVDEPGDAAGDAEADTPVDAGNAAYLIYTSGSTGRPKGVQIEHRSVVALIHWARQTYTDAELAGVLASTSICFDLSVYELFVPLAVGTTVVMAENALALPTLPARETVTLLNTVPSAAAELVRTGGIVPSVRVVNLCGEPLPRALADAIHAVPHVETLWNLYGPSEDTVYSTLAAASRGDARAPSIGRAIHNTRAHLLDARLRPVAVGVAGELYLAGDGLARGYLGRPALTAERFVPDPFSATGGRMYRTGDRARWRAEGEMEFLGRVDHQVKIRGFRIEPGEVEAVLARHASVRHALVTAREDVPGDKRLVAYVTGDAPEPETLRAHLRQSLPEHMVPGAFVVLDAFPLTPNGKVDRKALPAPDLAGDADTYVAPRTPAEAAVAAIWAEVLGMDRVGVEDSFFALGGHSLLATRVMSRLREALGAELPLRAIFETPTPAALAARIAASAPVDADAIRPLPRDGRPLPVSFAQRRLWFIDQLEPRNPAYNLPAALRLSGALDVPALERALAETVRRHETLRTVFAAVDGEPVQAVAPSPDFALEIVALDPSADAEAEIRRRAAEEAARPFDLARGPLLRAVLVRVSSTDHALLFTIHHAVSDGWSMGVLVREVSVLYAAFAAGEPSPLAELPVQYADYAAWQRDRLTGDVLEAQTAFWRRALAGAPPLLELPTDFPRPPVAGTEGGARPFQLSADATRALRALAAAEGATPFMAALAAFQALLARWSGSTDIAVGTPVAGRGRRETEGLIGLFVNTLVMRADLSAGPAYRALLRQVREGVLAAHAHQELPFEKLVEALEVERSLAHAPLFQAMFSLDEPAAAALRLGEVEIGEIETETGRASWDLHLQLVDDGAALRGWIHYRADLFRADTVDRMASHLAALLEHATAHPDAPVAAAPLIGQGERELLAAWNDTGRAYPTGSIHSLFEAQAARTPGATALVAGAVELTYAELDARANRIARRLRAMGVRAETRVGVLLERGPDLLPALLGVLKAGGAYVPLDPAYPPERLALTLEDSAAPVLVTRAALAPLASVYPGALLRVDADADAIAAESWDKLDIGVAPESTAYLIYTSGSTGRPKGVQIEHRSAVAFLHWAAEAFPVGELAGVLASTSVCFDLSVFELFLPLAVGTTVILAENALALPALPARGRVTLVNTVPSAAAELVRSGGFPDGVRVINLAGEPLPRALADALYALPHVEKVWDLYGPSEDTTYSTGAVVRRGDPRAPSIGRAIANTRAHLLDAGLQPVPAGVVGELCLAGEGLARGYLGRPALTAEKFVPDPWGKGGRMYRTGDRARWTAEGELEFLGRIDHQVKVRGFRIEPGEIETVLRRHPAVRDALVMAREDEPGDRRLVAYVAGAAPQAEALRAHLRATLPEHMVPGAFVMLDAFPLTPNGKVDRKALPAPDLAGGADSYVAPRTAAERALAAIWGEVLGTDRVGAGDSFWSLGGHSLLATRVTSRIRQALGAELPLRVLFEAPTLAALAARVDQARGTATAPAIEPLPRDGRALPLSFAQQRMWFIDQLEPGSAAYHISAALRIRGALDVDALARALDGVVARHEPLRTVFPSAEGQATQSIGGGAPFRLEMERLHALPRDVDAEIRRRAEEEAARPFDLARGPLLRATLLRVDEDDHALLFTMHHVVSDGWSMGVLVREVSELYAAFAEGRDAALEPLAVQYADYAAWQRRWLAGEVLEAQLAFWRERLAGAPPLLELPTDFPRPAVAGTAGATVPWQLSPDATRALRALAREEGATLYMAVLAAFQALLARWSRGDDVSVGTPVAGRERLETEALIGLFVNTLVIRTDLSGTPGYRALLRRVRDGVLAAHAHQDLPFEKLVDELGVERTLAHAPLFQAVFALDEEPAPLPRLGRAAVEPVETGRATASWDLSLHAHDEGGRLGGTFTFRADLFTPETVARFGAHLSALLEAAAARPDAPVSALPLLAAAEEARIAAWEGRAPAPAATPETVHARFAARAAQAPGAPALTHEGVTLTYGELEARANRLARLLIGRGVRPEDRVALYLERGVEMVVAILATLKAGAGYVPVDTAYPPERIAFMLGDAAAPVALTSRELAPALPSGGVDIIPVEDAEAEAAALPATDPGVAAHGDNLAYVIYTSGSTGQPKGVPVTHHNVLRLLDATDPWFRFGAADVWTLFHSYAFDFSVWEIWGALLYGGRVVVVPRMTARSPEDFRALLAREGVTVLNQTPSAFRQLIAADAAHDGAGDLKLRAVIFGGEALEPGSLAAWTARHGLAAPVLVNMYGITETTVHVTYRVVGEGDVARGSVSPIGVAIPDLSVHVLDEHGFRAPVGVPGELHVGGAGLARGYLGRPALTAQRFVPDPFGAVPGARLYRSGDLARWRADGELEYLGRIDTQVKIRGFRIELGEIEAALAALPAVREAVVVVREDQPGDKRLAAYLVPAIPGELPSAAELRAALKERLPEYMVPAAFVALDAIPLTTNGKVDRRALPAPEAAGEAEAYAAPTTDAEARLAEVWASVLGVARVGIHQNFFEAGGDSILSIQLVARARRAGVEITPRQVFEHPTIAGLARVAGTSVRIGIDQGPVTGNAPLTPVQRWFFAQELAKPGHHTMPALLAPRARVDARTLSIALAALVRHHDALRLRFTLCEDGGWSAVHADEAEVPVETIDLTAFAGDAGAAELARRGGGVQASLDLGAGPLLRAAIFEMADGTQRVLLAVHHLVADGVSWRVLLEDLEAAYAHAERGETVQLPEKTTSFREWGERLTAHAAGGGFDRERVFWARAELTALPPLPADLDGANTEASADHVTVALDAAETRALLHDTPAAYRTQVNDVLLAALARAFAAWTGERRLRVDLESHGREELFPGVDLGRTVGWFTAIHPVVLDAGEPDSPGAALKAVKEALRAVPNRGIGHGALRWLGGRATDGKCATCKLADQCSSARGGFDAAPAEVAFNYLGQIGGGDGSAARFAFAAESPGATRDPGAPRPWAIAVDAVVENGALRAQWTYSRALHHPETIEALARRWAGELRALVAHCADPAAGGVTPSDFPLVALTQAALDAAAGDGKKVEDVLPLGPMQEGMLFETLVGAEGTYAGQFGFTLRGALDVDAFRAAWQGVVDRHPALRARFAWQGQDAPLQVIARAAEVPFAVHDLRALAADGREARVAAYVAEDRARGFDPAAAPLLRLALFRVADDEHRLVWTHHHLVLDGWSLQLVYADVLALYQARTEEREARLPAARPYRDYLAWLAKQDRAASEAFWRAALAGIDAATPLGVEMPDAARAGWGHAELELPADAVAALQGLARSNGVTLNTVVQGAWALLLSRYAGERAVVFGATVSGRPAALEGVEATVGLFINTLPVRVEVEPGAEVLPWLRGLQAHTAGLREHEHLPLARIQRCSGVPAGEPLFESFVSFQNYPVDASAAAAGPFAVADVWSHESAGFPLTLNVTPGAASLRFDLHYQRSRLPDAAMRRLLAHLATVLDAFAAAPHAALGDVALLSEAERARVLAHGTGRERAYPANTTVHALIARRAAEWPHAVAAAHGADELTYAQLDARATELARVLRAAGVGAEVPVALFLDRGLALAVSILAVLKAGGFYVPVDPAYPAERLAYLLEDSAAPVILTRGALAASLPSHTGRVIEVDALDPSSIAASAGVELPEVDAEALAYAIYTSGSTGLPKAAMISHRSLVCYALAMADDLALGTTDRFLQFASPSFDVMVEEIFPAWLSGAAVVFPGRELLGSTEELARAIAQGGVTRLELPTAFWHEWARELGQDGGRLPECVRTVLVGGERVIPDRLRAWAGVGVPLVHVFGLTETSVTSTTLHLAAGEDASERWSNLPVGRPIDNVRVLVLDERMRPVPAGVIGEMYIGGDGVARGYRGRPALTAGRYVPDPLAATPGARLYRTGDRVRWLDDGTLEFLGRTDHQVKIRGFRIEPAEIEAALVEHASIAEATVQVRHDAGGEKRLVAYFVAADAGRGVSLSALRAHLSARLPEYMVPALFVALDAIPLTGNGKVDRRALPAPDAAAPAFDTAYEAPRTPAEAALAAVWAEVLGVERIGVHDDFFEAGGDSILSIQIVSRARRAGVELTPRQVFEHRTVAALARAARTAPAVRAEQGPVAGEAPLTPIQRWFFAQPVPERHHWNLPLLVAPRDRLDAAPLAAALDALLRHHDALRLRFERTADGGWAQTHAPADERVPLDAFDFSALAADEGAAALARHAAVLQRALELSSGPLVRAALFDLGAAGQRLLLAVHHLVVDGVSWRVLLEDLETAYDQAAAGRAITLPEKTTSFREWSLRLAAHAAAGGFDGERAYWDASEAIAIPPLPVDFQDDKDTEESAEQLTVTLTRDETRALLHDVPAAYRTQVNDVLLTALARAFARWTGEPHLRVDLEGHGREELFDGVDLSRTVGWFTTLYPVVLPAGPAGAPGEALKAVKETLRAVPNRGIGHGALRWIAQDKKDRAAVNAEVRFEYLGQLDAVSAAARFRLADEESGAPVAASGPRSHRLVVGGGVMDGELRVSWTYSRAVHRHDTVQRLADDFAAELRALAGHCARVDAGGCTPSDFPLVTLGQTELDALVGNGRGVDDVLPLSPMQEGMLFHTLYQPGAGAYVGQIGFTLEGPLRVDAFERAWNRVAERHAALRAGFHWHSGAAVQVVRRAVEVPFTVLDWRGLTADEAGARRDEYLAADRARGFDPAAAPLLRVAVARTGAGSWWALWSFHQMVLDGWSLPLVFRDVAEAYRTIVAGGRAALARGRPYRDYLAWLAARDPAAAEAFWRGEMEGFAAPTPLPGDRGAGRAAPGAEGYGVRELRLDRARHDALRAFARTHGLTVNTLVQGAWALLLARHAREEDVLFGATVSGRPPELEGVEEMVGLFINTLPLRVNVDLDAPALPWLQALQARQAGVREFGEAPLARVQGYTRVPRGQALFDSIVVFENYPVGDARVELGGVEVRDIAGREQNNFPFTLTVLPGAGLTLSLKYDAARFTAAWVQALASQLDHALAGFVADGGRALGRIPLMDTAERERLLALDAIRATYPAAGTLHDRFAERAARTPDAVALAFEGTQLTYAALDARANQVAHLLRSRGVGPEVRVGLFVERSAEMVVALLGILKAGGAYVPMDAAYPAERLGFMLEDAEIPILVTQSSLLPALPPHGAEVICVDRDAALIAAHPATAPEHHATADSLAYVIYTSGSTGKPKGVLVAHSHVLRLFAATEGWYGFGAHDAWSLFHSHAFDVSVYELWGALLYGGRVVVVPFHTTRSPDAFRALLAGERVTILSQTPSAFRPLVAAEVAAAGAGRPPLSLRRIIFAGEALEVQSLRPWFDVYGDQLPTLVNMYGITETTVHVTYREIRAADLENAGSPIGVPMPDLSLYLLDAHGEPVPVGVPGELVVGGAGVTRGYLNRPELTGERFVRDPFVADPEARMYRSGDLARRRDDGELEYLGRMDQQVKIRGFRVELGEIESALAALPAVREAAVLAREDVPGDRRLAAYLVPSGGDTPAAGDLRAALAGRLPGYMIPASFTWMDALPLTSNGKLDRRALPAPGAPRLSDDAYAAPLSDAERVLCAAWAKVLRVERIGTADNFFEAGGDSILSIQVVAEARRAGVEITPRQLFENPTVAALARVAGRAGGTVHAEQGPVTGAAPLTPIQRWFFEQPLAQRHHWNQSLLLVSRERLDAEVLGRAATALVGHHDALRLRFAHADGAWTQTHAPAGEPVHVAEIDLSGLPADERLEEMERRATEIQASLDLAAGPVARFARFELGDAGERLLIAIHHLAVDGVSWRLLLEDLETACTQAARGEEIRLPAKTTAFAHWAARLAGHALTEQVEAELDFWSRVPADVAPLPVDFPAGTNPAGQGRTLTVSLEPDETESLLRRVPAAYHTRIDDALLAALALAIGEWTGDPRAAVAMEGHGREELFADADLSRTVGWFTSLYPVVVDAGADGPGAALKAVKEQLRAIPRKGIGYGVLRWMGAPAARAALAARPWPQVVFNYLGQFDGAVSGDAFFALAGEAGGWPVAADAPRAHLLDLNARVEGGRLHADFTYGARLHRPETVRRLADAWLRHLRALIEHCAADGAGGHTPSDFPLAGIDAGTLAMLEADALGDGLDFDDAFGWEPDEEMDAELDPAGD
ncbi:MAG TPA: non-ribosomal peptide synthase/polyketide synthase [Longimicrobium sp.]|nr:non-ribosomal peptide synthase/polyketide synthase [Longimicrobium sp.]